MAYVNRVTKLPVVVYLFNKGPVQRVSLYVNFSKVYLIPNYMIAFKDVVFVQGVLLFWKDVVQCWEDLRIFIPGN